MKDTVFYLTVKKHCPTCGTPYICESQFMDLEERAMKHLFMEQFKSLEQAMSKECRKCDKIEWGKLSFKMGNPL